MSEDLAQQHEDMQARLDEFRATVEKLEAATTFEQRTDIFQQATQDFEEIERVSEQYEKHLHRVKEEGNISHTAFLEKHKKLQSFLAELSDLITRVQTSIKPKDEPS